MGTMRFESFGAAAEVVCEDAEWFESLPLVLPPDWRPTDTQPLARFELAPDGRVTIDGVEFFHNEVGREQPLLRLGSVVRHHLALYASAYAFIHAGVVAVDGVAIVLPGSSHSGKTTLVAELVRAGATYYSDEYAVVDDDGAIHPYAKPLSIRDEGKGRLGTPVPVAPEQIASAPTRAGLVVLTSYAQGTSWKPTRCSAAEGALGLLANTVAARPRPAQSLAAASRLSRDAVVLAGERGEAAQTAQALIDAAAKECPIYP
jgi:hypothetical protein